MDKSLAKIYFSLVLAFSICRNVVFCVDVVDETSRDPFEGDRNVTFQNGSSYSGKWMNGLMEGDGVLQLANGDVYRCNSRILHIMTFYLSQTSS